jgi:hypothetical protein
MNKSKDLPPSTSGQFDAARASIEEAKAAVYRMEIARLRLAQTRQESSRVSVLP